MTAALADLTMNESLRSKLGAAAQKRASELPSWEDTARLLFDELRAVVSEARM